MLKYTSEAIKKIINDIKKIAFIIRIISTIFIIGYFAFILITNKGNFIINLVLAILYFLYTIYEIITRNYQNKKSKKIFKRSYEIIKLIIKGFTLGVTIYSIYIATIEISSINIILSTLMIILWIIQVLLEVVIIFVEDEIEYLMAGIYEDLVRPYYKVKNITTFITKEKPVQYEQPYKKEFEVLDKKVKENEKNKKTNKKFNLFRNNTKK